MASETLIERVARALYATDCAMDPIEPRKPEWGRGGYKTQVMVWHAMARTAIEAAGVEALQLRVDATAELLRKADAALCAGNLVEGLSLVRSAGAKVLDIKPATEPLMSKPDAT